MSDSVFTGSVVVVDEVPAWCVDESLFPERPAVPDASGEGEDALADARPDADWDMTAVLFERELALEGVVDQLDPLTDPAELAEAGLLVAAVGAHEGGVQVGDGALELLAGEPLVADDDLSAAEQSALAGALEHCRGHVALGVVRGCQAEADRHPVRRAQQVEPQSPEVARVRGAVAVGGPAGQLGAFACLSGLAARHRGGVQQADPLSERWGDPGEVLDDQADLGCERSEPL